jgi:hypothetical protein
VIVMTTKRSRRIASARTIRTARTGLVLFSTGLGLLTLGPVAPARADEVSTTTVRWSHPDEVVSGKVPLRAKVSLDAPADGWIVRVLTADGRSAFDSVCGDDFKAPRRTFEVECVWDTAHDADGGPAANQHYLLRLMTRHGEGMEAAGPDRAAAAANPAAAPRNVDAEATADGRTVLSWAANAEPDLLHYDIEERPESGEWTRIGKATGTTFEPDATDSGRRRFRVAAERRGPDGEAIGPAEWTAVSSGGDDSRRSKKMSGRQPRRSFGGQPRSGGGDDPSPAAAASPEPQSGPTPASDSGTRPQGEHPAAGERSASSPTTEPPAADRASLRFSDSSAEAFRALAAPPAPPPARRATSAAAPMPERPAPAPAPAPEPDPGYASVLPYAPPRGEGGESPQQELAAPAEGPAPVADLPAARRSNSRQRAQGLALATAGFAGLGFLARPARRSPRRRRKVERVVTAAPSLPTLAELAARVTSIEARLPGGHDSGG